jgi:hypothetical protein
MIAAGQMLSTKIHKRQERVQSGEPITRSEGRVCQVQRAKDISFVSFAVRTDSKPNADVAKFVCFTSLTRKYAPACVLIGCIICSSRKVPKVYANLWRRRGDQGRDFDYGGGAVKMGKCCLLMNIFCVKNECRGKIRSTSHGWLRRLQRAEREKRMSFFDYVSITWVGACRVSFTYVCLAQLATSRVGLSNMLSSLGKNGLHHRSAID